MKITEKETQKSKEIGSPFNGEEFIVTLRKLVPFERLIDKEFVVESYSIGDTKSLFSYLVGDVTYTFGNSIDVSAKNFTIHSPFTGRLEIFNKF